MWKIKSREYSDRNAKTVAYDKLVEVRKIIDQNATRKTVVKKINSLRSVYRKELKKVLDSERSGAGSEDVYAPHLWYFDQLDFIRDQEISRSTQCNMDDTEL